jgi:bifunctional ADP-heptose synthase (sugar kinase/adenylyltransferase)
LFPGLLSPHSYILAPNSYVLMANTMLSESIIERILEGVPALRIGVLGDLFLDRYLDIDAALTEPSIETGLDAYQVVRVRSYPGAAGTVINNLVALGVEAIHPIAVVGDDGEGYELRQALVRLAGVDCGSIFADPGRRTPTYTKPMLCEKEQPPRELNRLDIKNRAALSAESEAKVLGALADLWPRLDALLVLDQVSEVDCGVVTEKVRLRLQLLGQSDPKKWVVADSRERIGLMRGAWLKPNRSESLHATGAGSVESAAKILAERCGRPVFCTLGEQGILVAETAPGDVHHVAGFKVTGPVDPVGAGDSTSAAIACALACGSSLVEAAAFGNLVASITIQQLGVTGTASPGEVRARWREINKANR